MEKKKPDKPAAKRPPDKPVTKEGALQQMIGKDPEKAAQILREILKGK